MKMLNVRRQPLVIAGLVGLGMMVALLGFVAVVMPQKSKARDLDNQIVAAQARLVSLQLGGVRGPAIRAADLFQLARAMPSTPDMPGLLLDLSRAAEQSKVSLVTVTPNAPLVQADGSTALPLNVIVDGSWDGISTFVRTLRTDVTTSKTTLTVHGRLFVVDSVVLSAQPGAKQPLQATLTVNGFTYGSAATLTSTTATTTTGTSTTPTAQAAAAPGSTG